MVANPQVFWTLAGYKRKALAKSHSTQLNTQLNTQLSTDLEIFGRPDPLGCKGPQYINTLISCYQSRNCSVAWLGMAVRQQKKREHPVLVCCVMKIFGRSKPLLEVGKGLHSTTMDVIWVPMVMDRPQREQNARDWSWILGSVQ